ncbi:hypothetical protein CGZ93_12765 [Enemella dayhoffiae]|uniref:Trp biosynthesis-associated membrane protein n=1 Tax=Enemella dayhoffiae TaxID=2016507 RepID=A0A255H020_9ACTN|nr:Trp biosynthesis-associated membrane protein [Enemella dayhoffiae]OYO19254.1 hypothetical protein CGZ93_12765 [Enemella dayhoffiae]
MAESPRAGSAGRRTRAYALGGLALGSLLGLVLSSVPWQAAGEFRVSGNEYTGSLAVVLAAVVAAGTLLALLLRPVGRRILAVPLALAGIGMLLTGLPVVGRGPTRRELAEGTFVVGGETAAPWAYAVCGLIVLAAALLMLLRAQTWPRPADRFDRQRVAAETTADDDPNEVWKALDAGHDPTVDDPAEPPSAGPDDRPGPDRRE